MTHFETHAAIRDGGRLHDYVDGLLAGSERAAVEAHLASCAACRDETSRILALRARLAAAPRDIQPPRDLWPELRARLAARPAHRETDLPRVAPGVESGPTAGERAVGMGRPLPALLSATRAAARRATRRHALLAAAAVLLVATSSVVTATLFRRGSQARVVAQQSAVPAAPRGGEPTGPAAVSAGYERAAADLAATLEARRDALAPETVAKVEASLRVIDSAIAEARTALARDPGNQTLVELLSVTYRQKLDVLHRAAELSTGI